MTDADLPEQPQRHEEVANIDIFLRIKPVPRPTNRILVDSLEGKVEFNIPRDAAAGLINNSRERYLFSFNGILTPEAKQDEVFERVARPVVTSALSGFNGTVFAYGQTGSGKTFTITGGAERYVDRGIIPRTIACIYSEVAKQADYTYQVHISYLEIYNELGYDLLDPTREVQAMEDLPQVYIQEDEDQNINFKNLSIHRAATEEEALNLLFLGDTNRTVSETPMNQASTRSHCIFTILLEARRAGSDKVRRSKLNLVDLAGSERVAKTGVDGTILKEAKYINLSLHYLEQVIVALQERNMGLSRGHVPYRNSLMTMVLRDSLGGNCKTVMVATASGEGQNMEESISTCRFAQRVAMIRNQVSVNEQVDPAAIIRRLKQEVRDLKEELRLVRGDAPERGPLTTNELDRLTKQLLAYVDEPDQTASINLGGDMMVIRASWQVFKQLLLESRTGTAAGSRASATSAVSSSTGAVTDGAASSLADSAAAGTSGDSNIQSLHEQVRKLRLQVQQRDNEIAIMIGILKGKAGISNMAGAAIAGTPPPASVVGTSNNGGVPAPIISSGEDGGSGWVLSALLDTHLLADRHKAFEVFRRSYRQGQVIEDNKQLLRTKYDQAKALGAAVNASKGRINKLRTQIEQWRMQRSAACVAEGRDPLVELTEEDPREHKAKQQIEQEKASYKAAFSQLRDLKGEIEHLQLLLEQSRQKLQVDFQAWLAMIAKQQQEEQQQQARPSSSDHSTGTANGTSSHSRHNSASLYARSTSVGSLAASSVVTDPSSIAGKTANEAQSLRSTSSNSIPAGYITGVPGQSSRGSSAGTASKPLSANESGFDLSKVDPQVLEAATPHLTGNAAADEDILRFYEARAKLLQKLRQQQ